MSWKNFWSSIDESLGFQGSKSKNREQKLLNQQMKDYQEQSALAKEELARAKDQKDVQKRRIQEKQIRALRGRSSSRGFLGTSGADSGLTSQLGG